MVGETLTLLCHTNLLSAWSTSINLLWGLSHTLLHGSSIPMNAVNIDTNNDYNNGQSRVSWCNNIQVWAARLTAHLVRLVWKLDGVKSSPLFWEGYRWCNWLFFPLMTSTEVVSFFVETFKIVTLTNICAMPLIVVYCFLRFRITLLPPTDKAKTMSSHSELAIVQRSHLGNNKHLWAHCLILNIYILYICLFEWYI